MVKYIEMAGLARYRRTMSGNVARGTSRQSCPEVGAPLERPGCSGPIDNHARGVGDRKGDHPVFRTSGRSSM